MRRNSFRPKVEVLEDRLAPAGGTPPVGTMVEIITLPTQVGDFLPGANNQSVTLFSVKAAETSSVERYGALTSLSAISPGGINPFNVARELSLWADADANPTNGCEKRVGAAYSQSNWQGIIFFQIFQPVWVRPTPLIMEVKASIWTYPSEKSIGLEIAQANFMNFWGYSVSQSNVKYLGGPAPIHHVETATLELDQIPLPFPYVSVAPGTQHQKLLGFEMWMSNSTARMIPFAAAQGDLHYAAGYTMEHLPWDSNIPDVVVKGTVIQGGLFFVLPKTVPQGHWNIFADIGSVGVNQKLQLAFLADPRFIAATENDTNRPLQGFIFNGKGSGQLQMYAKLDYGATVQITTAPWSSFVVTRSLSNPGNQVVTANQQVTAGVFEVASTKDLVGSAMDISMDPLAALNIKNLWWVDDESGQFFHAIALGVGKWRISQLSLAIPNNTIRRFRVVLQVGDVVEPYTNAKISLDRLYVVDYSQMTGNVITTNIPGRDIIILPDLRG